MKLTTKKIERVNSEGYHGDRRNGLALITERSTEGWLLKRFVQTIRIDGRRTTLGLGSFPRVTLAEAREAALANLRAVDRGDDPRRHSRSGTDAKTYNDAAEEYAAARAPKWADNTQRAFRQKHKRIAPTLGDMPLAAITKGDVARAIEQITADGKMAMARQCLTDVISVMKHAVVAGDIAANPVDPATAEYLRSTAQAQGTHRAAVPWPEAPAAYAKLAATHPGTAATLAAQFAVLTGCRQHEVRLADDTQIDLSSATWTVPAENIKNRREHRVPLSPQAVAVIAAAAEAKQDTAARNSRLLFPGATGAPLAQKAMLRRMESAGIDATMHGWRSTLTDWARERTDMAHEVVELALAHRHTDATEAAYRRSDLFDRRRELMNAWADFVTTDTQDTR